MKTRAEKIMLSVFLLAALVAFGWYNIQKPSILILHSYDPDYAWSRDESVGLNRVLTEKYRYQVHWYYMDTKRHPDAAFKQNAGKAARDMIARSRPDVVIALDDDAQQLAAHRFRNDPHVKIVFAGVNAPPSRYGYDQASNVTGILERIPLHAVRDALQSSPTLTRLGRPVRIAYLGDRSETVDQDAAQVRQFNWQPLQLHAALQVATWPEWQAAVGRLGQDNDVLLLSNYRRLQRSATDPTLVPPAEVVRWTTSHSSAAVIGLNFFYTEDGGMLAFGASPYEQGEEAARMALALVLEQKNMAAVPRASTRQFIVSMRGAAMRERHFELPGVYEAAARASNQYLP